jgi:hypothetical protein
MDLKGLEPMLIILADAILSSSLDPGAILLESVTVGTGPGDEPQQLPVPAAARRWHEAVGRAFLPDVDEGDLVVIGWAELALAVGLPELAPVPGASDS